MGQKMAEQCFVKNSVADVLIFKMICNTHNNKKLTKIKLNFAEF
jgi:hypothetical protein